MLRIHKYDSKYNDIFKIESKKIASILKCDYLIEHIGSTAIPGVDGKGVIDIMIAFNNTTDVKSAVLSLKRYYYLGNDKIDRKDRLFMASSEKESDNGDIHLHLVLKNSKDFIDAILFRDYLINNPDVKQKYINLKYKIQKQVNSNRAEYTKLKGNFIYKIIAKAKIKDSTMIKD